MQDNNLPTNNTNDPVHVDDYQPPQPASPPSDSQPFNAPSAPSQSVVNAAAVDSPREVSDYTMTKNQQDLNELISDDDNVDEAEPVMESVQSDQTNSPIGSQTSQNQSLETQNIFDLLGVSDGKEDEKEAFLDELQEVIWEDFIENDVSLLLNEEQTSKLKEMEAKGKTPEVQEEMLVYLEELLPDLEDIMMDKALELKEDMVLERVSGMKDFYSSNQAALDKIAQAEELISQNKWADAGNLLNGIK